MSQYLRDSGYTVRVFNLVNPAHSDSWNCLREINGEEMMAQIFADTIIRNTSAERGRSFLGQLRNEPCVRSGDVVNLLWQAVGVTHMPIIIRFT